MSESVEIEAAGRVLTISNPSKVYFSQRGETKLDLVRYYESVAEPFMRVNGGRPL
ncbi:MAG: ATP-dependent DNA ligase, partial [Nocardia sp.]|nr:ATP-dependent DNA ligase [Nocardia sp.]